MAAYKDEDLFNSINELHIIDETVLKEVQQESNEQKLPLDDILLKRELISDQNLGQIIGDLISVPYIDLSEVSIPDEALQIIPETVAKAQKVIAYKVDTDGLYVATSDPSNKQIIEFLSKKCNLPVIVHYTSSANLANALALYAKNITKAFDDIIAENIKEARGNKHTEPPIIRIVDTIINYAYENNASDIHIEPLQDLTLVRFRIDGILHDIVKLPHELDEQIVTRIKVMADLRTDEHQEAQDGKIVFVPSRIESLNEDLDIRVSIAPITKGEKVVMRLLSARSRQFSLMDLGLPEESIQKVTEAYHLPYGMILATGPTGSGKTTTLYAILKLLNKREINIMTIEDPVEYQIDNINQIQVNAKTDLTFAKGLRSIVRQDPDTILVGEIRDNETADIAINSAMTGHLVLSSLHTNDALTTFPRLMDMGVEPYLIASTVNVVVAQRLVRKICRKCKFSVEIPYATLDPQIKKHVGRKGTKLRAYKGRGCEVCHHTGYTGRVGIFEVLAMSEELGQAIIAKQSVVVLKNIAVAAGMRTMLEDGLSKVQQGITTIEELIRVTKE